MNIFNKFYSKKDIFYDKSENLTGSTGISNYYNQFGSNKKFKPIRIYKSKNEILNTEKKEGEKDNNVENDS